MESFKSQLYTWPGLTDCMQCHRLHSTCNNVATIISPYIYHNNTALNKPGTINCPQETCEPLNMLSVPCSKNSNIIAAFRDRLSWCQ